MKVKYIGKTSSPMSLISGNVYECLGKEKDRYRIIDEEGYDENQEIQGYLYPTEEFEIVEE